MYRRVPTLDTVNGVFQISTVQILISSFYASKFSEIKGKTRLGVEVYFWYKKSANSCQLYQF